MDLRDDLRQLLLLRMPLELDARAELDTMDVGAIAHHFFSWQSRFVLPTPRTVYRSPELDARVHGQPVAAAIEIVADEIARGEELTPRLSTSVQYAYVAHRNLTGSGISRDRRSRRDLDGLLNDWGVHHLHLGEHRRNKPWVTRTGELLFVAFTRDRAYLIDVLPHHHWTDERLLEVMADNWPDAGIIHWIRSAISLEREISPEERAAGRDAGVNYLYSRNGKVFMPRGMLSLAGTSLASTEPARSLLYELSLVEDWETANPGRLTSLARTGDIGGAADTETDEDEEDDTSGVLSDWRLDIDDTGWVLVDAALAQGTDRRVALETAVDAARSELDS